MDRRKFIAGGLAVTGMTASGSAAAQSIAAKSTKIAAGDLPIVRVEPVPGDETLVSQLVAAAQNAGSETFDLQKLRTSNPERMRHPTIRQLAPGAQVTPAVLNGVGGEWISVPGGSNRITIVYFHGGMFIRGSLLQARGIASGLSAALKARAFSVSYRLAPEHPFPAAIEDGVAAYRGLLAQGVDPRSIVFAGDSCGGAIPVSVMLAVRDRNLPLPAACASISPMADLSFSGQTRRINALKDVGTNGTAEIAARLYLGNANPRDPLASPIFADLSGLPPLLVLVGENERLFDDGKSLALAGHTAGVDATLQVYGGMIHVFPMFVLRTGDLAFAKIAEFVSEHVA